MTNDESEITVGTDQSSRVYLDVVLPDGYGALQPSLVFEAVGRAICSATVIGHSELVSGIVVQAVFVPGRRTDEGLVVQAIAPAWFQIIRLLEDDPGLAYRISPRKWEEIIAGAYEQAGFDEVTLTPLSGDRGRDVIAVKKGFGSVRIIEQVKAYGPDHRVTANDVRALLGVLHSDPNASKGIVTTTSEFAPRIKDDPDIARQMPYRLELIGGDQLLDRLSTLADLGIG